MKNTILITGSTGFLGTWISRMLLRDSDCDIAAIVRAESGEEAERRLARLWGDWPEAVHEIGKRVQVIRGDLSRPLLGIGR